MIGIDAESIFNTPVEYVMPSLDYTLDVMSVDALNNPDVMSVDALNSPDVI